MAWCYVGGRMRNLTHSEMDDFDIDVNEGREWPEETPPCRECGTREQCRCGEEDAT